VCITKAAAAKFMKLLLFLTHRDPQALVRPRPMF
jgi:hypothetical protein